MKKIEKSMKSKILVPLVSILLVQTILLFAFVVYGGVSQHLRSNAVDILNENVENSKLQMERQIIHQWIRNINASASISTSIEEILEEQGKIPEDIKFDSELNREIVYKTMQTMINCLHRSYGNGFFMILDGPIAPNSDADVKAGVYIRDLDPKSYAEDNSDLLLERGLPSVSQKFGIPLDSYWELGFDLDQVTNNDYFYRPYNEAKQGLIQSRDVENYGYLGKSMSLNPKDIKVITYSIPLVLSDGTTIGVVGGDMTETQMRGLLNQDGNLEQMEFQILGKRQAGSSEIEPIVTDSALYDGLFGEQEILVYEEAEQGRIYTTSDKKGALWYGGIRELDVYRNNTPFEREEWVVLRLMDENQMFSFYKQMRSTISLALLVSVLFGILMVLVAGSLITNPIKKLVLELRNVGRRNRISLGRTHIEEIDELIDSIEILSQDVAVAASRISNVIEASGMSLGVFEYMADKQQVFCSKTLFELLDLEHSKESYQYLEVDAFTKIMKGLDVEENQKETVLFSTMIKGEKHWIKMKRVYEEDGNLVGVLTDVTTDILERKELERERNYDLLTNILNRRGFKEQVERMLKETKAESIAFVMWDLDNLKYVNDTYGHEEGDRYICSFAQYLKELEANGAIIDRHSGDEFMAVLECGTKEEQKRIIQEFMEGMKQITIEEADGYRLPLRASAGVAWYPEHATSVDELCRYADFAMYMAKHSVKGVLQEFNPEIYMRNAYLLSGSEELNHLLESKSVPYALQPIVSRTGEVYGYEALMRPKLIFLKNIGEVLHLAEKQSKLLQMEELTWMTAVAYFVKQEQEGRLAEGSRFFINSISSVMLSMEQIKELETSYPQYLSRIVLEVTEMEPKQECMDFKQQTLTRWGGMTAIDDFGSGYNSEGMLLKIHPQIIKLDIELVRGIDQDTSRQNMLSSLIPFCHQQNILVLAEGVETQEELETLMQMDTDLFQGYYLGRPELEVRPLNPYVVEKMKELSENKTGNCDTTML